MNRTQIYHRLSVSFRGGSKAGGIDWRIELQEFTYREFQRSCTEGTVWLCWQGIFADTEPAAVAAAVSSCHVLPPPAHHPSIAHRIRRLRMEHPSGWPWVCRLCTWEQAEGHLVHPAHQEDSHPVGRVVGFGTANPSPIRHFYHWFLKAASDSRRLRQNTICYPGNFCLKDLPQALRIGNRASQGFCRYLVLFSNYVGQIFEFLTTSVLSFPVLAHRFC